MEVLSLRVAGVAGGVWPRRIGTRRVTRNRATAALVAILRAHFTRARRVRERPRRLG